MFARTVRYFIDAYFPPSGIFVEAGSGTSETSIRIDKRGGQRRLVAVDIVRQVLHRSAPVMDARICGDIFHLPFRQASLDGIWNVGVMEHFTHPRIDEILREFHRTLRHGGRVIILWPGVDSIPQRCLRCVEASINGVRSGADKFRFHPDEISQLTSVREGHDVLRRNGFRVVRIETGLRSLMAFKTLVGEKR